jgi:hypothetical protein
MWWYLYMLRFSKQLLMLIRTLSLLQTVLSCKKQIVGSIWVGHAIGIIKLMEQSQLNGTLQPLFALSMCSDAPSENYDLYRG